MTTLPAQPQRDLRLTAYEVAGPWPLLMKPSPPDRAWMDTTRDRFAYRCLPMIIANEMGWILCNTERFRCVWNGGCDIHDVVVEYSSDGPAVPHRLAGSHFGDGILTFSLPYLFRTPSGFNLWVRGPVNTPRDGIAPLEGIVETDWSPATFTMNWRFTRPRHEVVFETGEPFALIVPCERHLAERFEPVVESIATHPEIAGVYSAWRESRSDFNRDLKQPHSRARADKWQRDYMLGRTPDGASQAGHQLRLKLAPFQRRPPA